MSRRLGALLAGAMLSSAVVAAPGTAQIALPEVTVTAPIRAVRPRPAPPAAVTVTPEPVPQGTLPIVTDQFATVTVVPNDEIRRSGAATAQFGSASGMRLLEALTTPPIDCEP